jgi:hypothetical protein
VGDREAVEQDRQDDDQGDEENRYDCRTRATVVVMLMNDCHT